MIRISTCFIALFLAGIVSGAPAPQADDVSASLDNTEVTSSSSLINTIGADVATAAATGSDPLATVPPIELSPNNPAWLPGQEGVDPQPVRGSLGAPLLGPNNVPLALQNPDLLAPPTTDHGAVSNAKWAFTSSHERMHTGGWAREQTVRDMPIATSMAGVNMRLQPGAVRELHWHKTAEWAYVLKGSTQITAVDAQGRNYVDTVGPGDLWYFPPGIPHSLQATNDDPEGSEFVLVFDDGSFSEDSTFLLTDWLSHVPVEVLEKNFQRNVTSFAHLPAEELYIFPAGSLPAPDSNAPQSPQGTVPEPFSFRLSQVPAAQHPGGTVKIVDSSTFKVSVAIAAAEVTVEPGAVRELHWHPTQDEWTFFL
ncbi:hypothetical protein AX16_010533 [Volvariella volvacea WC 439]|nr:hypothetical protein AX16_010533 [Volvariella volvacea WC 439]